MFHENRFCRGLNRMGRVWFLICKWSVVLLPGVPHFGVELQQLAPDAVLDLHSSEIGAEGARQLARVLRLRGSQSLRHIDLSSCNLTDLGALMDRMNQ